MTDPAVEAAQRAVNGPVDGPVAAFALTAAREALTPIRDLEVPQNIRVVAEMLSKLKMDTPTDQKITDDFVIMLRNMADNIEPLIYPSEDS